MFFVGHGETLGAIGDSIHAQSCVFSPVSLVLPTQNGHILVNYNAIALDFPRGLGAGVKSFKPSGEILAPV